MKAVLEIDCENPKALAESVEQDELGEKIKISSHEQGKKLIVEISADDFTALRAGVTSYLRLAKAALDVLK